METLRFILSRLRPIHPLYLMAIAALYMPMFALLIWSKSDPDFRPEPVAEPKPAAAPAGQPPDPPPILPEGDAAPASPVVPT